MKKNFLFATMFSVALAFGFTSCTDDEDEEFNSNQVTIKFDVNKGEGSVKDLVTRVGDYVPYPDGVTRTDYNLLGWSESPNGPAQKFYAAPDHDVTLYAVWGKIEYNRMIEVEATAKKSDPWDNQFWLVWPQANAAQEGQSYVVTMKVKAKEAAEVGTQTHTNPGGYIHWAGMGTVPFTTEWTEYKFEGTFESAQKGGYSFAFNLNDYEPANIYYFDDISMTIDGKEVITNGDCEGEDVSCFVAKEKGGSDPAPARIIRVVK
mgnify:CR=1 FL=1